jgi:DNA polymerase III delta prime subunit
MKNIKTGVDNTLDNQVEAIEKLDKYITKWNKYYNEQNFVNMEYQYSKIEEYLKEVFPLEDVLKRARAVENLHELIKNNGRNFDLTQEEKELATMLAQ